MSVGESTSAVSWEVSWEVIFEHGPAPTVVFDRIDSTTQSGPRSAIVANAAARALFGVDTARLIDEALIVGSVAEEDQLVLRRALESPVASPTPTDACSLAAWPASSPERFTLDVGVHSSRYIIVQFTRCDGWSAVDQVLRQQQRFRAALMELSELAYATSDDGEFYQRLIERAVEVVPGAQGGSVQLNIPGTTKFRFVAAVGYDLDELKKHTLDQEHFFRDAENPRAEIVADFSAEGRSAEITEWLETAGRLPEIVVNVSAPVLSGGFPVAFLSLDNFEDRSAMTETTVEMTTVLSHLIGELWRRRELEAVVRKEREAFRHLALHDPLTGLANRRSVERLFEDILESVRRRDKPTGVLFVDIDDFKGVNDRLGHEIGDQLLIGVANGLTRAVRAGDVVSRWGGDEFLVVPRRLDSAEEAMALAERILGEFEQAIVMPEGQRLRARMSVGVGWSTDARVEVEDLIRAADQALYEAKSDGKGLARLHHLDSSVPAVGRAR